MTEKGVWTNNSCTVEMPLVCFNDGGDDHYVLVVEDKSWFDARHFCRQHHTDLVSVRSPAENLELKRRLQEGIGVQEAWIGLHRVPWKWSDGSSSFFRKWLAYQPSNDNNPRACVTMQDGGWDDWNCSSRFNFLCHKITEVTPAPIPEPATIGTDVQRRTVIKMRLLTNLDLTDPTNQLKFFQQFEASIIDRQVFTDITLLSWSVRAETQPTERDERGEEIKKKLN
ncbi:macrophage mannose receptor 1 [Labrus mixtus]|uniref:macrophage mannose receptor 1 n=1 Tax=Labrus mixtus TaxID=508554 RepID=UPI0029C05BB4|nr:macrophage mannose receptor 1 [Labrus mixtus]